MGVRLPTAAGILLTILSIVPVPSCCQTQAPMVTDFFTTAAPPVPSPGEGRCVYMFTVHDPPGVSCPSVPSSEQLRDILARLSRLEAAVIGRLRPNDDNDDNHRERDRQRERERERERERADRQRDRERDRETDRERPRDFRAEQQSLYGESSQGYRERQRERQRDAREEHGAFGEVWVERDRQKAERDRERAERERDNLQKDRDRLHADKLQLSRENMELEKRLAALTAEAALVGQRGPGSAHGAAGYQPHTRAPPPVLQRMSYEEARAAPVEVQPIRAPATGARGAWPQAEEPTAELTEEATVVARAEAPVLQQDTQGQQSSPLEQPDCGVVVAVSEPETWRTAEGVTGKYGTWMRDPRPLPPFGPGLIFALFTVGTNVRQLFEYENDEEFRKGYPRKVYALPHPVASTGSVILGNCLYYQRRNSRRLLRYDLGAEAVLAERDLEGAGYHGSYAYSWGGYTDIDLAADETGLWAVYSTAEARGDIVLSSLDAESLRVRSTFAVSGVRKGAAANAFVACGRLYTLSEYARHEARLERVFDTRTGAVAAGVAVPFTSRYRYLAMLAYNPSERRLYAWDNYNMVTYNVTLA